MSGATPVSITATSADVIQAAQLDLVSGYTLTSFTVSPASQYGIFTSTGTITLSGPAASSTIVSLISANPALASVPASITVPAGSATVSFPIVLSPVVSDTSVALTASFGGITSATSVTVLRPLDTVRISKALYTAKSLQLRIEATSTSAAATLTVYNAATGALLGTLSNAGNGKYDGTLTINLPGANPSITLKSSLGGATTGAVSLK